MTTTSSSSGTLPTISRIARRTIGPIVSSSLSVGSTRLTVRPCFSLSWVRRRRSANSAWWKFDSPNQRSTRAGTARDSSAARSAATSDSARVASCSKVWRPMDSRVLTTTTVVCERVAMASGIAPNRWVVPSVTVGAAAPMTTMSEWSASRRIAARTFEASRTSVSTLPSVCCRTNAVSARSAWARTARVIPGGTMWRAARVASWRWAIAPATCSASSAWGPPRTGTTTRFRSRTPRCLTTAMSHGDSRRTSSIVAENGEVMPSRAAGVLPPQPKTMRSASSSAATSTMPSAACRPMRTIGWMRVPSGTKSRTRWSRRRA